MQITDKETQSDDQIGVHHPQGPIEHGIEEARVGVPPDRCLIVILSFEFLQILQFTFITWQYFSAVLNEFIDVLLFRI